jgi:hypothetical protein
MKSKDMLRFVNLFQQAFKKRISPRELKGKDVLIVVDGVSMWTTITSVSAVEGKDGLLLLGIERVVTQLVFDFKKGDVAEIARAEQENGSEINGIIKTQARRYSFAELQYDGYAKEWSIIALQEPLSELMALVSLWIAAYTQDEEEPSEYIKNEFPDVGTMEEGVLHKKVSVELIE